MALNETTWNASAAEDESSQVLQCVPLWGMVCLVTNSTAFFINVFHLFVISRLESLKGSKYRCVLISISLTDMTWLLVVMLSSSCSGFFLSIYRSKEPSKRLPVLITIYIATYNSYYVFLIAIVEKYMAICKPLCYDSSIIVRKLPAAFVLAWTLVAVLATTRALLETFIPTGSFASSGLWKVCFVLLLTVLPSTVAGVLVTKIYVELRRMRVISPKVNETADAAMYLIIIFSLEMIALIINLVSLGIFLFSGIGIYIIMWISFVKPTYTVSNVVIYGWRTKTYKQYVCGMLPCESSRASAA